MDINAEIDNRQKEIERLADERARAQQAVAICTERITYLRGAIDVLKALGEVQANDALAQHPPAD